MPKRITQGIFERKSVRVGSAALTLAMAATMAPGYVPNILDNAAAAQAPAAVLPAQTTPDDQIIDADMIASGRVTKAANLTDAHGVGKGLISGHVYLTGPKGNPGSTIDNGNIPMDGVTVYAQFQDKDGSYSPIFSAKTHTLPDVVGGNGGKGTFAFGTGDKGITCGPISSARSTPGRPALTRSTASGLSLSPTSAATRLSCSARPMASCQVPSMASLRVLSAPSV
ncbi:hypothetical protein CJ193_007890 [Pseudoglutamicibacter albus]|uniref:hypothetical protein n=1 Tax=Pseudoglutamicibacter albus TaxID=98671 RepID=UPI000C780DBB|nr:hypothetical protein [Pseudoglutamicibacter albus]PKY79948.1 hypothetical protein CYJ35_06865 [Pseudoglutamicibacter albus]WIK83990.1 hypothetical protein CJ193_007890 [Pseudoglutamicibacter albus]